MLRHQSVVSLHFRYKALKQPDHRLNVHLIVIMIFVLVCHKGNIEIIEVVIPSVML